MYNTKQISRFFLLCGVFLITWFLAGCSFGNSILGKWEFHRSDNNQNCYLPELEFFSDGTVKAKLATGTYSTEDNKFSMKFGWGDEIVGGFIPDYPYDYKIENGILIFSGDHFYCEFARPSN
jgi:hypothetical protein